MKSLIKIQNRSIENEAQFVPIGILTVPTFVVCTEETKFSQPFNPFLELVVTHGRVKVVDFFHNITCIRMA